MPPLTPPICLDKSYAQGAPADKIRTLQSNWTVVVPSAFYWETFTAEPTSRVRSVGRFTTFRRVHLGKLLQWETEKGRPATSWELGELSFSPKILSADWKLSAEHRKLMDQHDREYVQATIAYWKSVIDLNGVPGFSQEECDLARGTEDKFLGLCASLTFSERILRVATDIGYRHAQSLNRSWLHFRLFQAYALQGLVLLRRHARGDKTPPSECRLEHDAMDLEYLILGLHCGALATQETSAKLMKAPLSWRFKILEPNGVLNTA